jgi:hypothetical protein
MDENKIKVIKQRIELMLPILDEYRLRMYLAAEAKALGHGGLKIVSKISGMSRYTIAKGVKQLDNPDTIMPVGRCRKPGGGRKSISEKQPGIINALERLVEPYTKGDPESALRWTNKSTRELAKELGKNEYKISRTKVGQLLSAAGYGLQANKKTLTATPSHPDRNKQFEYINECCKKAASEGIPVLSIDAKKKERNFKNNGQTYRKHEDPIKVLDHDFPIPELGKVTPFGIYDVFKNQGFVNVGIDSDTAMFAVESVRKWWYADGVKDYSTASEIIITADCGGSNSYKSRLWKYELQKLANELGKTIRVLHYPPGTGK